MQFYTPTRRKIYFDGLPASRYQVRALHHRNGYVSQSILLLSGTIHENLKYGSPEADHEEIFQAAKISGIHDFIAGLPDGYESWVGERGVTLSEGQK